MLWSYVRLCLCVCVFFKKTKQLLLQSSREKNPHNLVEMLNVDKKAHGRELELRSAHSKCSVFVSTRRLFRFYRATNTELRPRALFRKGQVSTRIQSPFKEIVKIKQ